MYLLYSIDLLIIIILYYLFVTRKERNLSAWAELKRVFSSRLNLSAVFKRVAVFSTVMIIFKGLFVPFIYLPYTISDFRIKYFETRFLNDQERKLFVFLDLAFTFIPFHIPFQYAIIQYRKAYAPHFPRLTKLLSSKKICLKSDFRDHQHCSEYMSSLIIRDDPKLKEKYYQEFLKIADNFWEKTILYNYENMPVEMCDKAIFFINLHEKLEDIMEKVEYGCYELKCENICWQLETYMELPEISEEYKKY